MKRIDSESHFIEKRSKSQISSELDNIKGIGPQTKKKLLSHFKSIKRIKEASDEEIIDTIGMAKGKLLSITLKIISKHAYFNPTSNGSFCYC